MSLVASAPRMDLDVGVYLESVLTHMLRGTAKTEELLPVRWTAAHPRGCARVPRARATRQGRYGRSASSTTSGTCGAPQRQIVRQKIHFRGGVYHRSLGLCVQSLLHGRRYLWDIAPQCQPRRDNRIIHLDPSTGHGHVSKPKHQQISPRCLYAYGESSR